MLMGTAKMRAMIFLSVYAEMVSDILITMMAGLAVDYTHNFFHMMCQFFQRSTMGEN